MKTIPNNTFIKTLYKACACFVYACAFLFAAVFCALSVYRTAFYPLKYKEEIFAAADSYGLSRTLVLAVVKTESDFEEKAVSPVGAKGLIQITEETGKYIAEKLGRVSYDLSEAKTNLEFGCYYLKYLILRFKEEKTALAAYNAGEGNVSLWLADERYCEDGKTLKKIPFPETEAYLKKIYKSFEKYRKLYGKVLDK